MEQEVELEPHGIEQLTPDLLLSVFSHCDTRTLLAASGTCRHWHELAGADALWEPQVLEDIKGYQRAYRLSSNEMGGCALQASTLDIDKQVAQARKLLRVGDRPGSWKQLYHALKGVDQNWDDAVSSSRTMLGHGDFIRCMQLSGNTLVSASGSISHQDCTMRVWDMQSGQCTNLLRGHMGPIWCMAYDAASNRVVSGSDDYTVRYWDATSGNCVTLQDPDSAVRCINMDPVDRQLVAGTEFGRLLLWDMNVLEETLAAGVQRVRAEFEQLAHDETDAAERADERAALATAAGGMSVLVQPGSRAPRYRDGVARYRGQTAQEMMDARRVVVDGTNQANLLDAAEEGKAVSAIQVQGGLCASTSIEPLSRIQLWDVSRGGWVLKATVGEPEMMFANSLSFEKHLNRMVAGCGDKNMRVWDLETNARVHLLRGHTDEIHAHQFDERCVASASLSGHIRVWDIRSGGGVAVLEHDAPLHSFQFHGDRLVSGTWDGRVCLWDMRRGALVHEWESHNERVWAVAMDRYHVVSAALDRAIVVRSFAHPTVAFAGWAGGPTAASGGGGSSGGVGSSAAEAPVP